MSGAVGGRGGRAAEPVRSGSRTGRLAIALAVRQRVLSALTHVAVHSEPGLGAEQNSLCSGRKGER